MKPIMTIEDKSQGLDGPGSIGWGSMESDPIDFFPPPEGLYARVAP